MRNANALFGLHQVSDQLPTVTIEVRLQTSTRGLPSVEIIKFFNSWSVKPLPAIVAIA